MEQCEFSEKCPMFNRFRNEAVRAIWITYYCQKEIGNRCARKILRKQGKNPSEIPITLLPNGMYLADLEDVEQDWDRRTTDACRYLEACAEMFTRFQDPDTKIYFGRRYCLTRDRADCHRKQLMDAGTPAERVAVTMLPNGEHLMSLAG